MAIRSCPHPACCREPQRLGMQIEFAENLQLAGNRSKGWELLCRVTAAEGRMLEMF